MFSVMIPCHDPRIDQFHQCLRSVLCQIPEGSQVCVVDDASEPYTAITLEHICKARKVEYVRTEKELGGVGTHNRCFFLAKHDLIHLLHPDDFVLPGFYGEIAAAVSVLPKASLYATQTVYVDEYGVPTRTPNPQWTPNFPPLHEGNPICVASCVTRRSFCEKYGGWHEELFHTADWEYWIRCVEKGQGVQINWPLACWRQHPANHTGRLMTDGSNLRNYLAMADVVGDYAPHLVDSRLLRAYIAERALQQAEWYALKEKHEFARANRQLAGEMTRWLL